MAIKEIAVKKYVVKLSDEEREQLNTLIRNGGSFADQNREVPGSNPIATWPTNLKLTVWT